MHDFHNSHLLYYMNLSSTAIQKHIWCTPDIPQDYFLSVLETDDFQFERIYGDQLESKLCGLGIVLLDLNYLTENRQQLKTVFASENGGFTK